MKRSLTWLFLLIAVSSSAQTNTYKPTAENLAARQMFQDMKFGMFIHWGASSVLGDGEWVMNNRNIKVHEYNRLQHIFNPVEFDAAKWVATAKNAGMKYITFITRHHDSFSNWDTKQSNWKITNTAWGKDPVKLLADECQKQGIKLVLYYSLVDWYRSDYQYETGRTGKGTGRKQKSDWNNYISFMKAQLTELLTNYGTISGIWFDGHWDQTNEEGAADRTSRINWHYDEIYGLIHKLQPQCMIGNNHHLSPLDGEDFQMFERDLPGENKSGLSFQKAAEDVPVETCETLNGSWGFNITDRNYKSPKAVIHYLVNAAGRNANFLLNIGPMPNGVIQPEFTDTLKLVGDWLAKYGESIYGTRGKVMPPQTWGVLTKKDDNIYIHVLKTINEPFIFLASFSPVVKTAVSLNNGKAVKFKQTAEGLFIYNEGWMNDETDNIIKLAVK
jgi:alpha-L-fucosidase